MPERTRQTEPPGERAEFRHLTADDFGTWEERLVSAYGDIELQPDWRLEEFKRHLKKNAYGLFAGEKLLATCEVLPMKAYYGRRLIPCAAISAVATAPEERRRGHASVMFREMLETIRKQGYPLSALYPFSYAFYRKLGWEYASDFVKYEIPLSDLPLEPPGATGGRVRIVATGRKDRKETVQEGAIDTLQEVYRSYARRFNGMFERSEEWWRQALLRARGNVRYTAVWEDPSGRPGGYCIYAMSHTDKPDRNIRVREMVALSAQARRGLLAFLRNQEAQYKSATLELPPSDPFPLHLSNPRIERKLQAGYMLRLVDVGKALEETAEPGLDIKAVLALSVEDEVCEWNDGQWLLEVGGGTVKARRTGNRKRAGQDDPGADSPAGPCEAFRVRVHVRTLAQIVSGFVSAERARFVGRVDTPDNEAIEVLDSLYGSRPSHLSDFF